MNIIDVAKKVLVEVNSIRLRDRRASYASSVLSCLRDQYWEAKGEPVTNPTDVKGKLRMSVGKWVEEGLIKDVFSHMHLFGIHLLGTQISVGQTEPAWDGYVDLMVGVKLQTGIKKYLVEIKTASGFGADLLYNGEDPKDGYLAQLGLYLDDAYTKKGIKDGMLFYMLLSDKNFGQLISVDVEYLPESRTVRAYKVNYADKPSKEIDVRVNLQERVIARLKQLEYHLATDTTPEPEFHYKYPLTPEFLAGMSVIDLKKAWRGEKILGDWQVKYSRYKDKILALGDGYTTYTEAERALIKTEHDARLTEKGNKVRPLKETENE